MRSAFYKSLNEASARQIHDEGLKYAGRNKLVFRPFCFSNLIGKYSINSNHITFCDVITWHVASIDTDLISQFVTNTLREGLVIGQHASRVLSVVVEDFSRGNVIQFISPASLKQNRKDGLCKSVFYSPLDPEFNVLVTANLKKKYELVYGKPFEGPLEVKITPLAPSEVKKRLVWFKNTCYEAYEGRYLIEGPEELIQVGFYMGIGQRNSQGFGMFEFV